MTTDDSATKIAATVAFLRASRGNLRCQEIERQLTALGFEVKAGRKPGHKVIFHSGIPTFFADGYTCGHGKDPTVKPIYVIKIAQLLQRYEAELIDFLQSTKVKTGKQ